MATQTPESTPWHDDGFAERPDDGVAKGGERIYRAYGGTSGVLGNCFFAPAIGSVPIGYWTAELLEFELNAALWGNDFDGVTKFDMIKGARFQIGPIAHDNYVGLDEKQVFYQRAFFTPGGIFKQVKFVLSEGQKLMECVKQVGSFGLATGRYAREASARAKKYHQ